MNINLRIEHNLEFLHRLVRVYTCQNATLLEITCRGSFIKVLMGNSENHKSADLDQQWLPNAGENSS